MRGGFRITEVIAANSNPSLQRWSLQRCKSRVQGYILDIPWHNFKGRRVNTRKRKVHVRQPFRTNMFRINSIAAPPSHIRSRVISNLPPGRLATTGTGWRRNDFAQAVALLARSIWVGAMGCRGSAPAHVGAAEIETAADGAIVIVKFAAHGNGIALRGAIASAAVGWAIATPTIRTTAAIDRCKSSASHLLGDGARTCHGRKDYQGRIVQPVWSARYENLRSLSSELEKVMN